MNTLTLPYTHRETNNNMNNHPVLSYNDYDMQLAESIIKRLVPQDLHINDLNIAVRYELAAHVGGDLAYVYPVDSNRTFLTICDVVGHGVASCLMAAFIHTQALLILQTKPENLFDYIHQLNEVCYQAFQGLNLFFTYAVVEYDHSKFTFQIATCGHPSIMILKSNGLLTFHSTPCTFLGMFHSLHLEPIENVNQLDQGDKVVLYTDGILEAKNPYSSEFFGEKRFVDLLLQNRHLPNSQLAEMVVKQVREFSGQEHQDDLTLMILSRCDE